MRRSQTDSSVDPFVLTAKRISNKPMNDKGSGQSTAYQGSSAAGNKDNFAHYCTAKNKAASMHPALSQVSHSPSPL